jgi:hypothetical protein
MAMKRNGGGDTLRDTIRRILIAMRRFESSRPSQTNRLILQRL